MQPIILLAIGAVAVGALSSGFLINNIELTLQDLGVGMEIIETPITQADIDFEIGTVLIQSANGQAAYKNVIEACSFHSDQSIPGEAIIICKLTNEDGNIIAEGRITIDDPGYVASDRWLITIDVFAFENSHDVKNVHDVTLVVLGDDPTEDGTFINQPVVLP